MMVAANPTNAGIPLLETRDMPAPWGDGGLWPTAPVRRASRDRPLRDPKAAVLRVASFEVRQVRNRPKPIVLAQNATGLGRTARRCPNQEPASPKFKNGGGVAAARRAWQAPPF